MTYASTGLIAATDYNTLANGSGVDYRAPNLSVTAGVSIGQGGVVTKVSGSVGYNAQAYSYNGYQNTAYTRVTAVQSPSDLMFGLNTDPTTNASYTSIDYAFWLAGSAYHIMESGTDLGSFGTYVAGTVFEITYDGATIRYYKDGVLQRSIGRAVSGLLYFDSSISTVGNAFTLNLFGPNFNPVQETVLWPHSGVTITGTTITKTGGTPSTWDAGAYGWPAFYNKAYTSAKASQTNVPVMFGLNSDPATDTSYASIDYAWYFKGDGTLEIYENGSGPIGGVSAYGAYTTSTVVAVYFDGDNVNYYKDGALMRSVARSVGAALYFDSSFYLAGSINSVMFIQNPSIGQAWGVGAGSIGLGQDVSSIANVAASSSISAAQWTSLIQKTNSCLGHQGVTAITPASVTAGGIVTYYADITRGAAQAAAFSSTTSLAISDGAANTQTFTGAWGASGSRILQSLHTFTFASANAKRYFFNAGGRIKLSYTRTGGSSTVRNTDWTNLLTALGVLQIRSFDCVKAQGTGSGTPSFIANNGDGGAWGINTMNSNNWQMNFQQFDSAVNYTTDGVTVFVDNSNPDVIQILTYMANSHVQVFQDAVDGTTTSTAVVASPATTYLTNTWGTPTYTGSIAAI